MTNRQTGKPRNTKVFESRVPPPIIPWHKQKAPVPAEEQEFYRTFVPIELFEVDEHVKKQIIGARVYFWFSAITIFVLASGWWHTNFRNHSGLHPYADLFGAGFVGLLVTLVWLRFFGNRMVQRAYPGIAGIGCEAYIWRLWRKRWRRWTERRQPPDNQPEN